MRFSRLLSGAASLSAGASSVGTLVTVLAACGGAAPARGGERGIAFSSDRDGDFEIYVMDSSGGDVRQLTRNGGNGEADDGAPAWSPDGRRIAFTSTRDHSGDSFDEAELYLMDASGGEQTRLTENESGEGAPGWSPDGESLLYSRRRVAGESAFDLALRRVDGTTDRVLLEMDGLGFGSLSPDGTRLAFTRCDMEGDELDCEIWLADGNGGNPRRLFDSGGRDLDPAWSPEGTHITFVSDRDRNGTCLFHDCWGHNGEIYVMDADGSGQTRLTDDPGDDQGPTWSPDGSGIAFAALRDIEGAIDEENYEIYVMDAGGSNIRQLTDNTAWDVAPDWR